MRDVRCAVPWSTEMHRVQDAVEILWVPKRTRNRGPLTDRAHRRSFHLVLVVEVFNVIRFVPFTVTPSAKAIVRFSESVIVSSAPVTNSRARPHPSATSLPGSGAQRIVRANTPIGCSEVSALSQAVSTSSHVAHRGVGSPSATIPRVRWERTDRRGWDVTDGTE